MPKLPLDRRRMIAATLALVAGGCAMRLRAPERGPIAMALPGRIDDGGFVESGYRGLKRAESEFKIPARYVDRVASQRDPILAALRDLARSDAKFVIALGGQMAEAAQRVAWEVPEQRFVVIQGDERFLRPNLAIYEVQQEQSTWLAGALAGLVTKSNVVGHMSGLRVPPGLKARAAFADGLATANPAAKLLTNFSGDQDDAALAKKVALAQIAAGADVVYTMLNAGRTGAIEACRERGVKQIGNALDWVAAMPDVFVGSAYSDAGAAVFAAVKDLVDAVWRGDVVKRYGLRRPEAVRLVVAPSVPADARAKLDGWRDEIVAGRLRIPETYTGAEFAVPR